MFTKPNTKSISNAAMTVGAFVVGAKVGDGIAAIMPDSTAAYKKWLLAAGGIIAAASVSAKTPTAQGVQNALLGLGAKQICAIVTDELITAIPQKDNTTVTGKFVNALVGHEILRIPTVPALHAAWIGDNAEADMWSNPQIESAPVFLGV